MRPSVEEIYQQYKTITGGKYDDIHVYLFSFQMIIETS